MSKFDIHDLDGKTMKIRVTETETHIFVRAYTPNSPAYVVGIWEKEDDKVCTDSTSTIAAGN